VQHFWAHRHDLGDAYGAARQTMSPWYPRRSPLDYLHVALPPSAVLTYRRQCLDILASHALHINQTALWDHAGLFSAVFTGGDIPRQTAAHHQLLVLSQDLHGSMEYCHGVGARLAPLMAREHGVGLAVLRGLKHSLDPHQVLNPGKLALHENSHEC
jgi:FAD/FMN-containing dehydrogenase